MIPTLVGVFSVSALGLGFFLKFRNRLVFAADCTTGDSFSTLLTGVTALTLFGMLFALLVRLFTLVGVLTVFASVFAFRLANRAELRESSLTSFALFADVLTNLSSDTVRAGFTKVSFFSLGVRFCVLLACFLSSLSFSGLSRALATTDSSFCGLGGSGSGVRGIWVYFLTESALCFLTGTGLAWRLASDDLSASSSDEEWSRSELLELLEDSTLAGGAAFFGILRADIFNLSPPCKKRLSSGDNMYWHSISTHLTSPTVHYNERLICILSHLIDNFVMAWNHLLLHDPKESLGNLQISNFTAGYGKLKRSLN